MPPANILITASGVLVALIGLVLQHRGLSTLNNRVRLHAELVQHAPSEELKALLEKEVAEVVKRDGVYLSRGARFYLIQGLLWLGVGVGFSGLLVNAVGLIGAIWQGVPYSPGLRFWLPIGASFALIGLGGLLLYRTPASATANPTPATTTPTPATTAGEAKDVTSDVDLDDAKAP